jgi:nucleoside-diphosphate-sugar epimerase
MITLLGAGGVVSDEVVKLLAARKQSFRIVGRHPHPVQGATEVLTADLSDKEQTVRAVAGSSIVYLLVGLKYDHRLWAEYWPGIMANAIEACKRAGAKLIFFDNLYAYGKVSGPMTEETPFNPCSKKGEVRAKIATSLINEWKAGSLTAMIARAADFYGPNASNGLPNVLVFEPLSRNRRASCLANDSVPHSYTYTVDTAQGLVMLAECESAWTGKDFIAMAAKEMSVAPKYRVLSRPMVRFVGWFNPLVGEVYEMLYQNDSSYLFGSSKFAKAFDFSGTPYAQGIRGTAASFERARREKRVSPASKSLPNSW